MRNPANKPAPTTTTTTTTAATAATPAPTAAVATMATIAAVAVLPAHMAPNANWVLPCKAPAAKPYTPGARTVAYAVLQALGTAGCTMVAAQAAVQAQATVQGLRGAHPVYALLAWLARTHGYTFTCTQGVVTYTVTVATPAPAAAPAVAS